MPPLDPKAIDELETFSFEDLPKKAAAMSARVLNPPTSETGGKGGNPPNPTMCRICHDDYSAADQLVRLPCGHIFHKRCARKWLGEETATCPVCRLNLLDPTLPARTAGSHTETSFSVPGNLTTPVHSDSAPSVVSSEQLDQEGARRSMTPGTLFSFSYLFQHACSLPSWHTQFLVDSGSRTRLQTLRLVVILQLNMHGFMLNLSICCRWHVLREKLPKYRGTSHA